MEYTLNVGEEVKIKRGGILTREITVTYAGMPSESAYSPRCHLAARRGRCGSQPSSSQGSSAS